jgi:hypothetical protein
LQLSLAITTANTTPAGSYSFTVNVTIGGTTKSATGTLTINKAVLTITANNASREYGDANPSFTVAYSGLLNGDVMTGNPALRAAREADRHDDSE